MQDGQGKADGAGALVVLQGLGAVELLAHVLGDGLVERALGVRELVGDGVGDALGEERGAVELEQAFLDHPAHQVGDVGGMHAVAEASLEAISIQQRHEELEVRLFAVVRRGRHQEEVPGQGREQLPELVALGVFDLAAEHGGGHLVGLVADHQVPAAVGGLELLLHVLVARELVESGDDEVGLQEPVAGARGLQLVVGEDLEGQVEAPVQLVLPLLGQAAGADDQAALQVAAGDQLLDEQARHDGLAGTGVVGQQEAQRLARQHGLVDGGDLVRQRVDHGGVHRQHRVEQVRQADAVGLGDQTEERAVAVEAPGPALLHQLQTGLVVAVEQLVGDLAVRGLVGQLQGLGAEPLDADHRHQGIGDDAADGGVGLELFELHRRAGCILVLGVRASLALSISICTEIGLGTARRVTFTSTALGGQEEIVEETGEARAMLARWSARPGRPTPHSSADPTPPDSAALVAGWRQPRGRLPVSARAVGEPERSPDCRGDIPPNRVDRPLQPGPASAVRACAAHNASPPASRWQR